MIRVSADQLDRDLPKCRWFSIHCDEFMGSRSMVQLMVFIRIVFDDFSMKDELLQKWALLPTTR